MSNPRQARPSHRRSDLAREKTSGGFVSVFLSITLVWESAVPTDAVGVKRHMEEPLGQVPDCGQWLTGAFSFGIGFVVLVSLLAQAPSWRK
jgi:hypothetical protein